MKTKTKTKNCELRLLLEERCSPLEGRRTLSIKFVLPATWTRARLEDYLVAKIDKIGEEVSWDKADE